MSFIRLALFSGLSLALSAPTDKCPASTSVEEAKKTEASLADLAVNFYKNVSAANRDKNVVLSPVSVALGLALLESGASGETRNQIKRLLAGASNEDVLATYRALQKQLSINDEKTKLSIANGMFPAKTFSVKPDYESTIRDCFQSEIKKMDFQQQLEQARQEINRWVGDKTSNKIPELFKAGVLTPDVVLVLANAIYFKGAWKNSFYPSNTKPGVFYRFGREQEPQTVQFMKQTGYFRRGSESNADVLEVSYDHPDLDMYILLPKAKDGLGAFEQDLTGEKLKGIISGVRPSQVQVQLPRFTIRLPVDLKDTLSNMGLGVIFSDAATFGRMSEAALKVSKAVHEAYINVSEAYDLVG